jgi:hypothetical protein
MNPFSFLLETNRDWSLSANFTFFLFSFCIHLSKSQQKKKRRNFWMLMMDSS